MPERALLSVAHARQKQLVFVREWAEDWTHDEMMYVMYQIETLAGALEWLEMLKEDDPEAYAKLMK